MLILVEIVEEYVKCKLFINKYLGLTSSDAKECRLQVCNQILLEYWVAFHINNDKEINKVVNNFFAIVV